MPIHEIRHPLVRHKIGLMREGDISTKKFRELTAEIARLLAYEACKDFPLETVEISPGDAFRYRPGTVHRVTAIEDLLVLEVSTPHLDDVVRLEDRYGREGTSAP